MEDTHTSIYISGLVTGIAIGLLIIDLMARIRQGRNF